MPLFRESALDAPKAFETAVIKKIAWRILPLILVAYCIAYVDRSNIAVAALTMNKDLGFSAFTYGLGAGIFFLGYSIFEIPSNLILERVGARRWIARIMFTWGILSAACAFVTGPTSFIVIRFLLGVAEAGFFPGVVLYFTYWFPDRYRGRIIATLFIAVPVANAFSNVVSGAILEMNGRLGLRGWQWVFLIEAAPAVILSFVVLRTMIDRPSLANWLEPHELQWLEKELNEERAKAEGRGRLTLGKALTDSRVIALSIIWMLTVTAGYGTTFFLPQIVKGLGLSNLMTGVASAIPYLVGMIALLIWGWSTDRSGERRWHFIVASVIGSICGCRTARKLFLVACGDVARSGGALWRASHVLATSVNVPERNGRCRRHRADQFDWKRWRLSWTVYRGLDQGFDQQLRNGTLFSRYLLTGLGRRCLLCQEGLRCTDRRWESCEHIVAQLSPTD
jgi:ACS family tartrate transporter-like MFS transporter